MKNAVHCMYSSCPGPAGWFTCEIDEGLGALDIQIVQPFNPVCGVHRDMLPRSKCEASGGG